MVGDIKVNVFNCKKKEFYSLVRLCLDDYVN